MNCCHSRQLVDALPLLLLPFFVSSQITSGYCWCVIASADARESRSPARQLHSLLYPDLCGSPISCTLLPPAVQPRHSCRREVSDVINFPLPFRPYDWLDAPSFPNQGHGWVFSTEKPAPSSTRSQLLRTWSPHSQPLVESFCKAEMTHPPLSGHSAPLLARLADSVETSSCDTHKGNFPSSACQGHEREILGI